MLEFLEQARAEIQDGECDMSKLELMQTLRRNRELIERREGENQSLSQQIVGKDQIILIKDDVVRSKEGEIQQLQSSLDSRLQQIQTLQAEITELKQLVEVYHVCVESTTIRNHNVHSVISVVLTL